MNIMQVDLTVETFIDYPPCPNIRNNLLFYRPSALATILRWMVASCMME
ncbi:hypothetical protein [Paenibacillus sp. YIM B09110]